jgi:hypothetical protein
MFYCIRCGHEFDRKNKLERHYRREKICKPIELDIPIQILKTVINDIDDNRLRQEIQSINPELYCKYLENQLKNSRGNRVHNKVSNGPADPGLYQKAEQKVSIFNTLKGGVHNSLPRKKEILICRYCYKRFSSYSTRVRHEKSYCPSNKTITKNNNIVNNDIDTSIDHIDETIINETCVEDFLEGVDREELLDIITNDASFICDLKNKLDKTISSSKHNNIHNIHNSNSHNTNITNNTINNNSNSHNTFNNTNNTNVTINQNTYGNEDFAYIVNNTSIRDGLGRLADNNPKRFFTELFRTAFFNKQHPENKTFKMINPKSNLVKILEKLPDNWIYASKTETYYDKVRQILTFITDHTDIVTEDSKTEKMIDEFGCDRDKTLLKEFETMENTNYKNNQLKEVRDLAELMNREGNILK